MRSCARHAGRTLQGVLLGSPGSCIPPGRRARSHSRQQRTCSAAQRGWCGRAVRPRHWPQLRWQSQPHGSPAPCAQVEKAVDDGYDVRSFMGWTLIDNFEVWPACLRRASSCARQCICGAHSGAHSAAVLPLYGSQPLWAARTRWLPSDWPLCACSGTLPGARPDAAASIAH